VKYTSNLICYSFSLLLIAGQASGKDDTPPEITYSYDSSTESSTAETANELAFYSGIERLFKNPAILNGLSSGSAAINRSIDSLMEIIFYSALDNQLDLDINKHSTIQYGLRRDVFNTTSGSYVVADRFQMGPHHMRELTRLQRIPLNFKADVSATVLNIYPRTDPVRVAESAALPPWRALVNNWFGILPFLTRILPPSFNPNELYNPIEQLITPFIFPTEAALFPKMQVGSIRSYAISSGVSLPMELNNLMDPKTLETLTSKNTFDFAIPVSVFVSGTHRINVLKKSSTIAWVSINRVSRVGAGITLQIGKALTLLNKTVRRWKGIIAPLFPVDYNLSAANADRLDQLYTFDLSKEAARKAYNAAINGDFTLAYQLHLKGTPEKTDRGVSFRFLRKTSGVEQDESGGVNLFLFRDQNISSQMHGAEEITDASGKFHQLQTSNQTQTERWDALTGNEQQSIRSRADLAVIPVAKSPQSKEELGDYRFDYSASNLYKLSYALNTYDRQIDGEELENFTYMIKKFVDFKMDGLPKIPPRNHETVSKRRQSAAFESPVDEIHTLHTTPISLGRFSCNASITFDYKALQEILDHDQNDYWKAFTLAYQLEEADWTSRKRESSIFFYYDYLRRMLFWPIRFLGYKVKDADFYYNAKEIIDSLRKLQQKGNSPQETLSLFETITASRYPEFDVVALHSLVKNKRLVAKHATFSSNANRSVGANNKKKFNKINNLVFRQVINTIEQDRSEVIRQQLESFYPSKLRMERSPLSLKTINLKAQRPRSHQEMTGLELDIPNFERKSQMLVSAQEDLLMNMRLAGHRQSGGSIKAYVRIEDAGALNVGKFVLVEQVVTLEPQEETGDQEVRSYDLWLSGLLSPLTSFLNKNRIVLEGNLKVYLSFSETGALWTKEQHLRFMWNNRILLPLKLGRREPVESN
jgi:hypothetical protein